MGRILYPDYFPNQCDYDGGPRWVQSTLKGYMRMIWRVKKWRISVKLSDHPTTPYDGTFDFVYESDAGLEEELVCGAGVHLIEHPEGRDHWDFEQFNIFPSFSAPNDYRPYISFIYAASADSRDLGLAIGDGSDFPPRDDVSVKVQQINITNFGNDTATITYHNFKFEEISGMQTEISAFKAEEYWSYGGTYNTETGEPL